MLIVTKEGSKEILSFILDNDFVLRLYVNDFFPDSDTIFKDFEEPSGSGYFPANIVAKKWDIFKNNSGFYEAEYPVQKFSFAGPMGSVYGYFLTKFGTEKILWAKRFSEGPFIIKNAGDFIDIEPKFSLRD